MKKLKLNYISVLLFIVCWNSVTDLSAQQQIHNWVEAQEVINTLVAMWDAIEKEDVDRYAGYIHSDFTAFGEYDSARVEGKKMEIQNIKTSLQHSSDIHTEMHFPKVTINGNVAWIVYYWSDSGISKSKPFATQGKSTRIFVR